MSWEVISVTDGETGAVARFLPGVGCNCFAFQVPTRSGPLDVLWSEPGFERGDRRASGSGIPLLFPFPGRIQGTTLRWDNRDYQLESGDGCGNAIHGFVHERPWRVIEAGGGRMIAAFQASVDDASLLERWPADFRITATYAVHGMRLSATYLVENTDERPLPCGFGTHPYFRLPLGGPSADSCRVTVPVSGLWELESMNPTGRRLPLDAVMALPAGQLFAGMEYDTVFTDLLFSNGRCEATIEDPPAARRMKLSFDRAFRECVVYTPPHRQAICIEPYTCVPDAFRLQRQGISAGLRILEPGESFRTRVDMEVIDD
jgi:aldose 1-epimerase